MEWLWIALITAVLFFCFLTVVYRFGFVRGYKAGARRIIAEWKASLNEEDENVE
jgi:hypothetical protein